MVLSNNSLSRKYSAIVLLSLATGSLAAVGDVLWIDDFNSDTLNSNYWSFDMGTGVDGWGNQQLEYYTDSRENVNVTDGQLMITAIRTTDDTRFKSGRIKTEGKVQFLYGRLEASIKIPNVADGLWAAFWTMGFDFNQVGWPAAGEIDIMEIGQGLAITQGVVNRRVISGAHWEHQDGYATFASSRDTPTDLHLDYHNYTLDWTPDRMATFVDGDMIWEMDIRSDMCVDCTELHQPHFMLLNLAVGGYFTSVGGEGSSGASSSSSAAGCDGSSSAGAGSSSAGAGSSSAGAGSSSAGVGSSSSGGCGLVPRTDVTAPLPATMFVDFVKIVDNGFTTVVTPDTPVPAATPDTAVPAATPDTSIPATTPDTAAPAPTPTPGDNIFETTPPIQAPPEEFPGIPEEGATIPEAPSAAPFSFSTEAEAADEMECTESSSGKGKGGKDSRRRRRLCGKSGKSGKGKGKGGKSSSEDEELRSVENESSVYSAAPSPSNRQSNSLLSKGPIVVALLWMVLAL